jgi:hypothetical protein
MQNRVSGQPARVFFCRVAAAGCGNEEKGWELRVAAAADEMNRRLQWVDADKMQDKGGRSEIVLCCAKRGEPQVAFRVCGEKDVVSFG